jgi:hypothetical protein
MIKKFIDSDGDICPADYLTVEPGETKYSIILRCHEEGEDSSVGLNREDAISVIDHMLSLLEQEGET